MNTIRTYSELIRISEFRDRFKYLQLNGIVGDPTFSGHRYLNQMLYKDPEWRRIRREIILRDGGLDLAHEDYPIVGNAYIHHIEPITICDILERRACVFNPENLISTSLNTHNALHYGDENLLPEVLQERFPNDTCPWRRLQ